MRHLRVRPHDFAIQSGFTLIEVMVGVTIIAVLSAMLVASLQSNVDRHAKLEAQRFIAVVNAARDEALISGKTLTLWMDDRLANYGFQVFGANQSQDDFQDDLFRTRSLHKSVGFEWRLLDELVDAEGELEGDPNNDELLEQRVFITPLGEITSLEIRFLGESNDYVVELNDEGVLGLTVKRSSFR